MEAQSSLIPSTSVIALQLVSYRVSKGLACTSVPSVKNTWAVWRCLLWILPPSTRFLPWDPSLWSTPDSLTDISSNIKAMWPRWRTFDYFVGWIVGHCGRDCSRVIAFAGFAFGWRRVSYLQSVLHLHHVRLERLFHHSDHSRVLYE